MVGRKDRAHIQSEQHLMHGHEGHPTPQPQEGEHAPR
jgi:hypothetical protein